MQRSMKQRLSESISHWIRGAAVDPLLTWLFSYSRHQEARSGHGLLGDTGFWRRSARVCVAFKVSDSHMRIYHSSLGRHELLALIRAAVEEAAVEHVNIFQSESLKWPEMCG